MERQLEKVSISRPLGKIIEKYNKDLIIGRYQLYYDYCTNNSFMGSKAVSEFYISQLPVSLQEWISVGEMTDFGGVIDFKEAVLVRDIVTEIFFKSRETTYQNIFVISNHMKAVRPSIYLKKYFPIYMIYVNRKRVEITLKKETTGTWIVSVKSKNPLVIDFDGIIDPDERIKPTTIKHFPKRKKYGAYNENNSQFTCILRTQDDLETFFYMLEDCFKK